MSDDSGERTPTASSSAIASIANSFGVYPCGGHSDSPCPRWSGMISRRSGGSNPKRDERKGSSPRTRGARSRILHYAARHRRSVHSRPCAAELHAFQSLELSLSSLLLPFEVRSRVAVLIHNQRPRALVQNTKALQKLDNRVLLVRLQRLKCYSRIERFSRMCENGFSQGRKSPVVEIRWLARGSPRPRA